MRSLLNRMWFSFLVSSVSLALTACGGGGDDGFFSTNSSLTKVTLESITVQADNISVPAGKSVTFQAIGRFSDGSTADLSNSSSTAGKAFTNVSWSASPEAVGKFPSSSYGSLSTNTPGALVVTATDSYSGRIGTATMTVTAPVQASIALSGLEDNLTISARAHAQLTAMPVLTDFSKVTATSVIWTTSNALVATVDASGKFQGVGAGTVKITATAGGFSKSIQLTLLAPLSTPLFTISCNPANPTIVDAAVWNNQFAIDAVNATEWVAVDGASCQSYAVVKLLVPQSAGGSTYYVRFRATRSSGNPAVFEPGAVLGNVSVGNTLSIGSSTTVDDYYFNELYTVIAK